MSDLHELVHILTRSQIEILIREPNPVFPYIRVSDAEQLLKEIARLSRECEQASDKLFKARIQTCPNASCHAQYLANSPEYPCPWCEVTKRDAEIQDLRNARDEANRLLSLAVGRNEQTLAFILAARDAEIKQLKEDLATYIDVAKAYKRERDELLDKWMLRGK